MAEDNFYRYLSTDGATTGTKNAVGDYSGVGVGPTDFYITAENPMFVHRMILQIEDTKGMTPTEYGNTGSPLANGWEIKVKDADDVVLIDITDGVPIKDNAGVGRLGFNVELHSWTSNAVNGVFLARFTFSRAGSTIDLRTGDKLVITLSDDMTGLVSHYFNVQGHY